MARIRFELSAVGADAGKRQLDEYIVPAIESRGSLDSDVVYIVPTQRIARDKEKTLIGRLGGALLGETVMTWNRLVSKAIAAFVDYPVISSEERAVLVQDILLKKQNSFKVLNRAAGFPGTASDISNLISEIKQNGILNLSSLNDLFANAGYDTKDGLPSDIITVFESYQNYLARNGNRLGKTFCDEEEALHICSKSIASFGHGRFLPRIKLLVLDGFYDFNDLQKMFITALIKSVDQTVFCLESDTSYYTDRHPGNETFKLPWETYNYFKNIGVEYEICRIESGTVDPRQEAASKLFKSLTVCPAESVCNASVNLICAENATDEIERIAAEIKRLCVTRLFSPDQIAVVFPSLENSLPLIEDIFPRYGIPFHSEIGMPLLSSPLIEMFFSMIEAPESGFMRQIVFNFLSSPYINLTKSCKGFDLNIDPLYFDTLAREAMIVGGPSDGGGRGWLEKLRALSKRLEWQLKIPESGEPSENTEHLSSSEQISQKLNCLNSYITFFERILNKLSPLASSACLPLNEYFRNIRELLEYFEVEDTVYGSDIQITAHSNRRALIESLKSIYSGLDQCESILSLVTPPEGFSPAEYNKRIIALLRGIKYRCKTKRNGVAVMGLYETRGLNYEVLFLGGMTENEIPRKSNYYSLLKQSDYTRLGIRSIRSERSEEQLLFHRIAATVPYLYVSYPAYSGESINIKSGFLEEIERRFETVKVPPPAENIFTKKQWLIASGRAASGERDPHPWLETMKYVTGINETASFTSMFRSCDISIKRTLDTLSEYDGIINDTTLQGMLFEKFMGRDHKFSATQMETYARCPFKYFCSRYVLNLRSPDEVEEDIPPAATGELIHEILKKFYRERVSEAGSPATPVTPTNLESAKARLYEIAVEKLAGLPYSGLFRDRYEQNILRGLTDSNTYPERGPGILLSFLEREIQNGESLLPTYFESTFEGVKSVMVVKGSLRAPGWECDINGHIASFNGTIDRIDTVFIDGTRHYFVADYKTGKYKSVNDTINGLDFQLPLYLLFITKIASEKHLIGAAYDYITNNPDNSGRRTYYARKIFKSKTGAEPALIHTRTIKGFFDDDTFAAMLATTRSRLVRIISSISEGSFHHSLLGAQNAGCSYCDFNSVCRSDAGRMKRVVKHLRSETPARSYYIPDSLFTIEDEADNESDA